MSFKDFFVVRLAWAVFGLWLAVTVVFVITRVLVSPADVCKGTNPGGRECYRGVVQQLRLDAPVHERYVQYLSDLLPGGASKPSLVSGRNPSGTARDAASVTLALAIPALLLAAALGTAAGLAWARAPRRRRRLANMPIYVAIGSSPIWVGLLASYYLGFRWGITSVAGYCDFFDPSNEAGCGGAADWLRHLILPAVTLSLFFAAVYARIIGSSVTALRATKADEDGIRLRRRLILVVARLLGRDFGYMIGAAVFVESVFSLPGLGRTAFLSVAQHDFVVLESVLVYAAVVGIAVHFLVDLIVGALDSDLRAEWPVAGMPKPT